MSLYRIKHSDGQYVVLDTKTQEYFLDPGLPNTKMFRSGRGQMFYCFQDLNLFIDSDRSSCVIPAYCNYKSNRHPEKRKSYKRMLYRFSFYGKELLFFETECTAPFMWESHAIDNVQLHRPYFLYIEKTKDFENGVRILSAMEIKKAEDQGL